MFTKSVNYEIFNYHCNQGGMLIVHVEIDGIGNSIMNIYASNNSKDRIKVFVDVKCLIDTHALFLTRLFRGGQAMDIF